MASKGAKVIAVDLSEKLIEFARKNSYHDNITYIVEDDTNLNLMKTFDLITIIDTMEHIPRERIESFFQVHLLNEKCTKNKSWLNEKCTTLSHKSCIKNLAKKIVQEEKKGDRDGTIQLYKIFVF